MRRSNINGRRKQLLALAVGAIPLSLCSLASAGVYSGDSASFTWINGSPGGAPWPQSSSNSVLASFNRTTAGNLLRSRSPNFISPARATSAIPDLASDLTLEVNVADGDVYLQAAAATALTGYDIFDKSSNLLDSGDPNTDLNERLFSQPSTATLGNQTAYRNATNYKLWHAILDNGSTLAEGQNNGKLQQGTASTYDTINIPAGGTIDFGDIFNLTLNKQDLTFSFSEADPTNGGNPVTGSTYFGVVNYGALQPPVSYYWKNSAGSSNWGGGNNWSDASPTGTDSAGSPSANSAVYIATSDAQGHVITLDTSPSISSLQIGNTGGGSDTLSQTTAFKLTAGTEQVGAASGSVGAHIQSAGSNTYSSALMVGVGTSSIGTYSLSGTGSVAVTAAGSGTLGMYVGYSGSGSFNQSGGTVTVGSTASNSNLYLGYNASATGTYVLGGGTLAVIGNTYIAGSGGAGTLSINGGTLAASGSLFVGGPSITSGGAGTLAISSGYATISGAITVYPGGTLNQTGGLIGALSLAQSGGTCSLISLNLGGTASTGTNLSECSISGGSMQVTNELQVDSGSSFTQSGGSFSAAAVTIYPGGTLSIAGGTISSPVNVAGTLAAATSASAITINGPLALASTATAYFQRVGTQPSFASVSIAGNITLGGNLSLYEDAPNEAQTTASQSFVLLSTAGALSGSFSNVTSGQRLETTDDTASFLVTVTSGSNGNVVLSDFILGAISGNNSYWENSAGNGNWSNGSAWSSISPVGTDAAGVPGSASTVYITNTDAQNRTVNLDVGDTIQSLQIGNTGGGLDTLSQTSAYNLTMSSEQVGSGSGSVGAHIQTAGTNRYSGALSLGVGTNSVGTYTLVGSGSINATSTQNTGAGLIVGDGGTGIFNQAGGTVSVGSYLWIGYAGTGVGTYNLSGGTLSATYGTYISGPGTTTVAGKSGTLIVSGGTMGGDISNYGTLVQTGGTIDSSLVELNGTLLQTGGTFVATDAYQSGGMVTFSTLTLGGAVSSAGGAAVGTYEINGTDGGATLTVLGGVSVNTGGTLSQTAGVLNASSIVQSGGNVSLTSLNIGSTASTGANVNGYTISAGSLAVANGLTVYSGGSFAPSGGSVAASQLTVNPGGTFGISGGTINAPVSVAGTFAPTASGSAIRLNGALTLASTATAYFQRVGSQPSFASILSTGNIALGGSLSLYEDAGNEAQTTASQSFVFLSTTGTLSGSFSNVSNGQRLTTTDDTASFLVTINSGLDGDVVLSDFIQGTNASNNSYWENSAGNGNWSNGSAWSSLSPAGTDAGGVPSSASTVYITNTDSQNRTVTLDVSDTIQSLQIGNNGGGVDTLSQAGAFNLTMQSEQIGAAAGSGGVHTQSAGTNIYNGNLIVGAGTNSMGTYNLSGTGSVTVPGNATATLGLYVGYSGAGSFNQSGGTVTIGGTTSVGDLDLGYNASGVGNYVLSGGTLAVNGMIHIGGSSAGSGGSGTLDITGGSATIGTEISVYPGGTLSQTAGLLNTVDITQTGGTATFPTLNVGNTNSAAANVGGFYSLLGGTLGVSGGMTVSSVGTLMQTNGSLTANLLNVASGGTYNLSGGTINAPVTLGGNLSATASSIPIALNGSLTFASTSINLFRRAGSTPSFGSISATGNIVLGGALSLYEDAANEAETTASQSFVLLSTTGTLSGNFSNLSSGQRLTTTDDTASFVVTVNNGLHGDVVLSSYQLVQRVGSPSDLTLEVNPFSGDVYAQASAATSLTGYDIFDKSGNLLDSGDPNTDLNERLLSQPSSTTLGNQTTFRNATNYKLWATILDNTSTLAEGSNNGKLKQGTASTYDTINIPANGTIDFGDIYSTVAHNNDITFAFSEADPTNAGNPVTGAPTTAKWITWATPSCPSRARWVCWDWAGIMMMRRPFSRGSGVFGL
jgi:fibronectin-binding autotransporter adhesin